MKPSWFRAIGWMGLAAATLAMGSVRAVADWDPGDPYKMHYPQLPDPEGIDVCFEHTPELADDWRCTGTGPVTGVHFWVSFQQDHPVPIQSVTLRFYTDDRTGFFSKPGALLGTYTSVGPMGDFEFSTRLAGTGLQDWWCPPNNYYVPQDHLNYYQVNCTDFQVPWSQTEGNVYWLSVKLTWQKSLWDEEIGWKTSGSEQFEDNAVYRLNLQPNDWAEIPDPRSGEPLDLAFVIQGLGGTADLDFGDAPNPYPTRLMSNGARHVIVPTAPWLGDATDKPDNEPDGQPEPYALGDDTDYMYPPANDDEDGVTTSLLTVGQPGTVTIDVSGGVGPGGWVDAWVDWNANGTWEDPAERIVGGPLPPGLQTIGVIPPGPNWGQTFMRVRIHSFQGQASPWGLVDDGEVEDHEVYVHEFVTEELDFGDAPDPYPTLLASNGARHPLGGPWMGPAPDQRDAEPDGQPDPAALGDDLDTYYPPAQDDEDGVVIPVLFVGQTSNVVVIVNNSLGSGGWLDAWIDWNMNWAWDDPAERIFGGSVPSGVTAIPVTPPPGAVVGQTYARFRIHTGTTSLPPVGPAPDGEVEDYTVEVREWIPPEEMDFGDAPTNYPTLLAANGARHKIAGPWLGDATDAPDAEPDGQPTVGAVGDDTDGNDDEDGVSVPGLMVIGLPYTVSFSVGGVPGFVYGWIDWNGNGVWGDRGDEQILRGGWYAPGGPYSVSVTPPLDAVRGVTYARFRIDTDGYAGYPAGLASNGEVEDYRVWLEERFDFGDASDPYPTLLASNGAYHIVAGPWLGPTNGLPPDWEPDGQPDPAAMGDDFDLNGDDEDGVLMPASAMIVGLPSTVQFWVGGQGGYVSAWIDWNGNGVWGDRGDEQIVPVGWYGLGGPYSVSVTPPLDARRGLTYARFRIDTQGYSYYPTGLAYDGEVEDYTVFVDESFDYGDAPLPYPTLLASNGAQHIIAGPYFGGPPDKEPDGQPSAGAVGDDMNGAVPDDEDGVLMPPSAMIVGLPSTVQFWVGGQGGNVCAWIDWNGNGVWGDRGDEQVVGGGWYPLGGPYSVSVTPPLDARCGLTYVRFRIDTQGRSYYPAGLAYDGEVEDYTVFVDESFDYGDAPQPYPTLLASNGAQHLIAGPYFGGPPDKEPDGQPSAGAVGDDMNGAVPDDEDGVIVPSPMVLGQQCTIQYQIGGQGGYVSAWIDWNRNGVWGDRPDEQVLGSVYGVPGPFFLNVTPPSDAAIGQTYVRFRIDTQGVSYQPTGLAMDGEVEDNAVDIREPSAEDMDFGDAPDPTYPTLLTSSGARHVIVPNVYLGAAIDADTDGQPTAAADGDDADPDGDDEDGCSFSTLLVPADTARVQVLPSVNGYFSMWVDWNANGDWDGADEWVFADQWVWGGAVNDLSFPVPFAAATGPTFVRCRFSTLPGLTVRGLASNGEVEDYRIRIEEPRRDYGDAEDPLYPTLDASGGAYHLVDNVSFLGWNIDAETDGQPDPNALGDDYSWIDDEDGVTLNTPWYPGQVVTVDVLVSGPAGYLNAWVDFNADGDWVDLGEQVAAGVLLTTGNNQVMFQVPLQPAIGPTFARFRWSSAQYLPFTGPAPDGEVEDYEVLIDEEPPPPPPPKWVQGPDLSTLGMDVYASAIDVGGPPVILADDFLCTQTGPITNIVVYGSWKGDMGDPMAVWFTLSIHGDILAGQQAPWSMPSNTLWQMEFGPGMGFEFEPAATGLHEGWYNPASMPPEYLPFGDTVCWKYSFNISTNEAFVQRGTTNAPVVYWLDVQAHPYMPDAEFGWKTSTNHWNDDAVWVVGYEPYNYPDWMELRYPQGHPLYPQSLDLAFEIRGAAQEEPEPDHDFGDAPLVDPPNMYPTLLPFGARHTIVPNFTLGTLIDAEPNGQPHPQALGDDMNGVPDEDGVTFDTPILPGGVGQVTVTLNPLWTGPAFLDAWIDYSTDGTWDSVDQIAWGMWLAPGPNTFTFGVPHWAARGTNTFARFRLSRTGGVQSWGDGGDGEVEDYMVMIGDPVPPPEGEWKWQQPPDLNPLGMDVHATLGWGYPGSNVLADDFLCTSPGVITNIVVWGSWEGDEYPFGNVPPTDTWFSVCFYEDIPADENPTGYSMPGSLRWQRMFTTGQFRVQQVTAGMPEGWYDPVTGMYNPEGDWTCWKYTFAIDPSAAFQQQGTTNSPVVYWLSVQAWPDESEGGQYFGWKCSESHWNDDAVWADWNVFQDGAYPDQWHELRYPQGHPGYPQSMDLAFELLSGETPPPQPNHDFGDAPDPTYPTLRASNGARHPMDRNFHLGQLIDAEWDGQPTPSADGDDLANLPDEDGVAWNTPLVPGNMATVTVTLVSSVGGSAYLDGWVDFGANGSWAEAGDRIFTGVSLVAGANTLTFLVPASAVAPTNTFARFRLGQIGGLSYDGPGGTIGEVEDYLVTIEEPPPPPEAKWLQPPDLHPIMGVDVHATLAQGVSSNLLADDFLCTVSGPITNIVVWGSWLNDYLPFEGDPAAVRFCLSIHEDIPESENPLGYSMPGRELWRRYVSPASFAVTREASGIEEGWYDPVVGQYIPVADMNCWKYTFSIPKDAAFWQGGTTNAPVVYWLDVQAWPMDGAARFGWKTSSTNWNDDATWTVWDDFSASCTGGWHELTYPVTHPREGQSIDLAFALYGSDEGPKPPDHDFGDAPDPTYPTLRASNGARHRMDPTFCLGALIDAEYDGQPTANADGDDLANWSDEDGIIWMTPLVPGNSATVAVTFATGGPVGYLDAWIDFGADGSWAEAGDQIFAGVPLVPGSNVLGYSVPVTAMAPTNTYARFRLSQTGGLTYTGPGAYGEVEDYWIYVDLPPTPYDFGDAPDPTYPTLLASGGAQHPARGPLLGSLRDTEGDGQPDPVAMGDDNNGLADEDGVLIPGLFAGQPATLIITVSGAPGVVDGWVDFNASGSWDPTEQVCATNLPIGSSLVGIAVPGWAVAGGTFARFRISSGGGLGPAGLAPDGEVEDYAVRIEPGAVTELCPKWIQEPDCEIGIDVESWQAQAGGPAVKVADDWKCDGRPVVGVEWYGSYLGYASGSPDPVLPMPGMRPQGFQLTWYAPAAGGPGGVIRTQYYPLGGGGGGVNPGVGVVGEQHSCASRVNGLYEHEYRYTVEFPDADVWNEKEGRIYWLSVQAVYAGPPPQLFPWGWATTPVEQRRHDGAVEIRGTTTLQVFYPAGHPYEFERADMAFTMLTDVCPRRAKKWSQPPDMINGTDMASWRVDGEPPPGRWLRADDFISDGRRITDIHWWGSYIDWQPWAYGTEENPVLPPHGIAAPVAFELSWHTNAPGCLPAEPPLARLVVPIEKCHEVFYGSVQQYWMGPFFEHEYQYYVDLLDPRIEGAVPWAEVAQGHYWLNIQAVFEVDPELIGAGHSGWGWKITTGPTWAQCASAVREPMTPWQTATFPSPIPGHATMFDLAFELTTDGVGESPYYEPITITAIERETNWMGLARMKVASVGDWGSGAQILQTSTDLVEGVWTDLRTNAVPQSAPDTNLWFDAAPGEDARFFRVLQRQP